ncbi:medium chain dehydrogenase/reductase family protein [uncultured Mucilaginibacter sp.]|uniref:medium chain dehydrogenase/reductase family protein n=1 Tax=uncultured Mucilaginibacter sp. TaxID=797541 RepID=UPI002628EF9C|nr:medium chain dehydrogenase/reductase family protein [uncultured Mucilaginibacter sp.]
MLNKRIVIERAGGVEVLKLIEEPIPQPKANEVLIQVRASGVAFGDILFRQGISPATYPMTPGYDIAGEVEAIGSAVTKFKTGDTVAGFSGTGGYTTYICLPENQLTTVPDGLNPEETVSVVLNYTAAYQLLTKAAGLKSGNSILIHGAAGGVGTAVLQLAKILGIKAYGTVSTSKIALVEKEGGIPIDYTKTDFVEQIRLLTEKGVDAVLDPIGGNHLFQSYKALNKKGRLVVFGVSSAVKGEGNPKIRLIKAMLPFLLLKLTPDSKSVVISTISTKTKGLQEDMAKMVNLLNEGKIKPIIAKAFPLAQAAEAQLFLEQTKPVGKIILQP